LKFDGFAGAAYTADSLLADAQSCINWYIEGVESGDGQNVRYLRETPGLTLAQTLPTSPIRGIWIGEDRMFVVAGSKLYECFSNNTNSLLGDVGDDASHSPVQMFPNGNQLFIVSAGYAWVATGVAVVPAIFPNRNGSVSIDATGLIVTWLSGAQFDASMVGLPIYINAAQYTVASYTSATVIGLTTAAPTSASSTYQMALAVTGTATASGSTTLTWASGNQFDSSMVGQIVAYAGATYTVATYTDATHLVMTAAIPSHAAAAFSISQPVTASQGAYLDGSFIVVQPGTRSMFSSALNDGTTWIALDTATKEGYPDIIESILADHEELYVWGSQTSEVWRTNPSSTAFACQRDPGAFMHHGCIAKWSSVRLGEGVAWLGGDPRGWTVAYRATGYIPARVSTHAIEAVWASYSTTADAVAYVYTDEGHEFWVINFPTGNATWVYDATAAAWHRRGWWNGSSWDRQRAAYHGFVFGNHYVGDWSSGNLYIQSTSTYDDNGTAIYRQRAAPHLNTEHLWTFYNQFELLTELGNSAAITLDWSDDGGVTWHAGVTVTSTTAAQRYVWRRLGRSRDRIFRITMHAATKQSIVSAYLQLDRGIA
jgi:hypothetical protein